MTALLTPKTALTAVVVYKPGRKVRVATEITIKAGPLVIATAERGGKWSQADAVKDFVRNHRQPKTYAVTENYQTALALGILR